MAPQRVLRPVRPVFRAMACAFVPEAGELSDQQWARAEARVETSLAPRPPAVKRQIQVFLRLADWTALLRFGRRLSALDPERRLGWLRTLERAPVARLRQGVWGIRTLAFMAYYGLPEVRRELGYRAHADGWSARSAAAAAAGAVGAEERG